jgi:nucleotide-binding universal stress UspA family protein
VAQLARPILAEIAVLAVQPYLAATNSQAMFGQGVETWLASDTPLGQQLRHILNGSEIAPRQLHLQFRGGSPERQMRQAVIEAQPDLIVIAAEAGDWCERRVLGQLVKPLLQQVDRPVLVAKSGFFSG